MQKWIRKKKKGSTPLEFGEVSRSTGGLKKELGGSF